MIMKCPLRIYFRGNYVVRCFTVLLRCTESYSLIVGITKIFVRENCVRSRYCKYKPGEEECRRYFKVVHRY